MKASANITPKVLMGPISGSKARRTTSQVVQRVGHLPVDAHLEVQVVAVAAAGAPAVPDDLSLADVGAEGRGKARLVGVAGGQRLGVLDAGEVAISAGLPHAL